MSKGDHKPPTTLCSCHPPPTPVRQSGAPCTCQLQVALCPRCCCLCLRQLAGQRLYASVLIAQLALYKGERRWVGTPSAAAALGPAGWRLGACFVTELEVEALVGPAIAGAVLLGLAVVKLLGRGRGMGGWDRRRGGGCRMHER